MLFTFNNGKILTIASNLEFDFLLLNSLEQVKADKYSVRGCFDADMNSPKTPVYDLEDAANSLVNTINSNSNS